MGTDLQARLGVLLDDYRRTRARVEALLGTAVGVAVSVRAPDRSVTVSIDPAGRMLGLRLDPVVIAGLDAATLALRIIEASKLAHAQARAQLRCTVQRALPERLRDLVGVDGSVDLAAAFAAELDDVVRRCGGPRT
jgi:hypothetical protein